MSKLTRLTAKIFGETASTTNTPKEIGQFGSAKTGAYNATGDVATIQSLSAWSNGWIDAVTPTDQFPPLPEMTGVHKVLSYQSAYLLQQGIPEWDSATTYYTNSFCQVAGIIYKSKTDNNLNNDPTSDNVNWEEFTSGGGSRNIGEIVSSTIPLTDAGLHLLDGALIDGSGIYADFVDYIAGLYDSGDYSAIFDTEANWQSAYSTYGVCGKFVYNSTNNTVRLPKITGFIEGGTTATVGNLVEAGLPNITGNTGGARGEADIDVKTGVFSGTGVSNAVNVNSLNDSRYVGLNFDASRSNSIYGNSSTVQPQAIKVLYYIVIATTTKTAIEVDIDEIATDLNGKADTDLSNVPSSKGILTETYVNGTSWYRVYSDGWCEQGGVTNVNYSQSTVNVTLLKQYGNVNYNILLTAGGYAATGVINDSWQNKTTSRFTIYGDYSSSTATNVPTTWQTCGYIS